MTNAFIRACLSLIETIRQKWNARFGGRRSNKDSNNEKDGETLHQSQLTCPSVLYQIHTDVEIENEIPVGSAQYNEEFSDGNDDETLPQRQNQLTRLTVLDEIHTEVEIENEIPVVSAQYNVDFNDEENLHQRQRQLTSPSFLDESSTEEEEEEENEVSVEPAQCMYERETEQPAKDEYVYRLLRFTENHKEGLRPKNLYSSTSLERHVERGSRGVESRYISCCKTMSALRSLGGITNEFQRVREVVRINISKLDRNAVKVIDLTDYNVRRLHISYSSSAWGYAERFDEVILAPSTHVPKECVERIGIVHYRSFTKDDHVEL
ncbi:uncharacterized protein LOC111115076 [Crassostrea virginica]